MSSWSGSSGGDSGSGSREAITCGSITCGALRVGSAAGSGAETVRTGLILSLDFAG